MKRHPTPVPDHLAIIMDGNGRWATQRGRPRWMGHVRGAQTVRKVVTHCARRGVGQLTLYAFSSDNWKRPEDEVKLLFELFATHLDRQLPELISNDIRLTVIGRRDRLPRALAERINAAEAQTQSCRRMHLRVAIDYSSRAAIQNASLNGALNRPEPDRADATGAGLLPTVDMILRTGGERRLSDFLLWESAYAELAFLDVNFPDLTAADLDAVFADYGARDRRFGGVKIANDMIKESA